MLWHKCRKENLQPYHNERQRTLSGVYEIVIFVNGNLTGLSNISLCDKLSTKIPNISLFSSIYITFVCCSSFWIDSRIFLKRVKAKTFNARRNGANSTFRYIVEWATMCDWVFVRMSRLNGRYMLWKFFEGFLSYSFKRKYGLSSDANENLASTRSLYFERCRAWSMSKFVLIFDVWKHNYIEC